MLQLGSILYRALIPNISLNAHRITNNINTAKDNSISTEFLINLECNVAQATPVLLKI
jgi:hypothetical protein